MRREPRGQPPIVFLLRRRGRHVDTEYFGAHVRVFERAVQVGADHAGTADAIDSALV